MEIGSNKLDNDSKTYMQNTISLEVIVMLKDKRCVLIVDDEPKFVRAIKDFLKSKDCSTFGAYDGLEAIELFRTQQEAIDLILLDVMMPHMDGFTILTKIRESSQVPVIMLTAKAADYDQYAGFQKGADDYISKPFSSLLLYARIEAVLRRANKEIKKEIVAGKLKLIVSERTVYYDCGEMNLTRREYDLLYYLMINRGFTLTREQILNGAWGYEYEGDIRTVDTHVKQLRLKLGTDSDYIKTIHRVGYRLEV